MTQQVNNHCTTSACSSFNLDGVNMGSKTMREIMDAANMGHGWAKTIIATDQTQIPNARQLNGNNTRNNLYGALRFGLQAKANFNSSDASVRTKLGEWLTNLNKQFGGMASYTPASLQQRAVDLGAAADCIGKNTATLASSGELTASDASYLNNLVKGLKAYSNAATALHKAVCAGPGIKSVALNIQPNVH